MIDRFKKYLDEQGLIAFAKDKILLAVSGGIDSVCMTDLCHKSGLSFALAHCNFRLRGAESDGDMEFVRKLAIKYGCLVYVKEFDTEKYARERKISIQMAARELRYHWFEEIALTENYPAIAVAHNLNDLAETFLMNLIRGTGIKGLTGIKPVSGKIIRPMLFATRQDIVSYVEREKLDFREDSSNNETKYHRNLIRKEIIPVIERINPSFLETINLESEIFRSLEKITDGEMEKIRKEIMTDEGDRTYLSIRGMESMEAPLVYELISPFGFNYTDAKNLLQALHGEPGRKFFSENHILIKDRDSIIIEKKKKVSKKENSYLISQQDSELNDPIKLRIERFSGEKNLHIPKTPDVASLDADKLKFPLLLRHWREGDFFMPLGLKGRKKLSDFFIDRKINLHDKESIWLLCSEGNIIWIVGHQIDDRYKITPETRNVIQFRQLN